MSLPDFTTSPYKLTISPNFPDFPLDELARGPYPSAVVNPPILYSIEQSRILTELSARKDFCTGVKRSYIDSSIQSDQTNLLLTIDRIVAPERLLGFALIRLYKDDFEIDVLCSGREVKGVGTALIQVTKYIGQLYGEKTLKLDSVTEALGFYTKLGFECNELCPLKLDIPEMVYDGGAKQRRSRGRRRGTRNQTRRGRRHSRSSRRKRTYRR